MSQDSFQEAFKERSGSLKTSLSPKKPERDHTKDMIDFIMTASNTAVKLLDTLKTSQPLPQAV